MRVYAGLCGWARVRQPRNKVKPSRRTSKLYGRKLMPVMDCGELYGRKPMDDSHMLFPESSAYSRVNRRYENK